MTRPERSNPTETDQWLPGAGGGNRQQMQMGARDRSFWGDSNVPKPDGVSGCTAPVNLLKITELYVHLKWRKFHVCKMCLNKSVKK